LNIHNTEAPSYSSAVRRKIKSIPNQTRTSVETFKEKIILKIIIIF